MTEQKKIEKKIKEISELEEKVRGSNKRLRQLKEEILALTDFCEGSKTATISTDNFIVKVRKNIKYKWDAEVLEKECKNMPEILAEMFNKEYKALSMTAIGKIDKMRKARLEKALKISESFPSITIQKVR